MKTSTPPRQAAPRLTFARDELGFIRSIRSDEEVEIYIVSPYAGIERVYRWSSTLVGQQHVDEQLDYAVRCVPVSGRQ